MHHFRLVGSRAAPLVLGAALAAAPAAAQRMQVEIAPAAPPVQPLAPLEVPAPAAEPGGAISLPRISTGLLECRGAFAAGFGFGSNRAVHCEFRPTMGRNQYYSGTLERVGLDIGVSDQGSMLWAVLATSPTLDAGALAGKYVGVSSGISLGPGFSANLLSAQDAGNKVTLQPLSVSSDSGLSLSIAGATLTLAPSTARAGEAVR